MKPENASMTQIHVRKVTAENFKPYGQLIETPRTDSSIRLGFIPGVATYLIDGETEICVCSVTYHKRPIERMERHVNTPELFVVVEGEGIFPMTEPMPLTNVDLQPSIKNVVGFHVKEGQSLLMKMGLWHWSPWAITPRCSFLIIFRKDSAEMDLLTKPFLNNEQIVFPGQFYLPHDKNLKEDRK